MKKSFMLLGLLVPIYFISWTLVFMIFEGFDFGYYRQFLWDTLSIQGGEAVAFIRIYSILLSFLIMIIIFFKIRKK
jgi:hypothetical protein